MALALHDQSSSSPPSFCVISDGVKVYKDKIRRTAGGSVPGKGKIIKANDIRSSNPSTSSSIPSKYQTFFKSTTEKKGFHQQAPRFEDHLFSNDNPGPGSYLYDQSSFEQNSSSYSKQGTGGLASKSKRFRALRKTALGPGSYNPSVPPKRHSFNKSSVTGNFHQPFAPPVDDIRKCNKVPAPNSYDINLNNVTSKPGACAAFKSRYKRNEPFKLYTATNPAPGQYDVNDSGTRALPHSHVSSFKTVLKRNEMFIPRAGPGPGTYCPSLISGTPRPAENKHRSRHLLTFSAPAIPLPPDPPPPGPGHYEVVDYREPIRYECSGAVFLSATSRYHHEWTHDDQPGPGTYQPLPIGKQSFLYNLDSKWI